MEEKGEKGEKGEAGEAGKGKDCTDRDDCSSPNSVVEGVAEAVAEAVVAEVVTEVASADSSAIGITPLPTKPGLLLAQEVPPDDIYPVPNSIWLEFDAIQSEPAVEKIFLATGGSIAAAASRASTDFAVSGSKNSTVVELSDTYASTVRIQVPNDHFRLSADEEMMIVMSNRTKFMACTSRSGAAINGSIVTSISGQGAAYLSKVLKNSQSAVALPLTYAAWQAHSAVITASNFKLVDERDRHYSIRFEKNEKRDALLKSAETVLSSWAEGAWQMRQNVLQYPYSPSLSKTVARVPVGMSDTGYSLVHDVAEPTISEFSYATIDSLLEQGIQVDLGFNEEDVSAFLQDTKIPGWKAAKHGGRTVAAAMSVLANFLVSYRADGRTTIVPTGSIAIAAESWLRQAPRIPGIEANDCDGSCLAINNILAFVASAPVEVRKQFRFINAVYNVLVPHYQVGVSVLGASSAEASGGGKHKHNIAPGGLKKVAGHAVALLMPTMSILLGLERGSRQTVNGTPVVEEQVQDAIANARYDAMFPPEHIDEMPDDEKVAFADWRTAKDALNLFTLEPFAMEGTTPASPVMYMQEGEAANDVRATAANDERAFAKVGSNIGRSVKILYAGGEDGPLKHVFYSEFVEFTLRRSNPLWLNAKVRELGAACSQLVFSKHDGETISLPVQMAGSTPAEIVQYKFALVPLVVSDSNTSSVLDFASAIADADVMPPRPQGKHKLTKFQSEQLEKSLGHLEALNNHFKSTAEGAAAEGPTSTHPVAYILAFSTLVNNPLAVQHLTKRLEEIATSGVVDAVDIEGLMMDHMGRKAGKLVVVNAFVRI